VAKNIKVTLILDDKPFIDGLKKAERAASNFGSTVETSNQKANSSFNLLNTNVGRLTKLLGIGALVAFGKGAIALGDQIKDLSDATGFSVERIAALNEAFINGGGSSESASQALSKFALTLEDLRDGNDKTLASFNKLGISLTDIKNRNPEQLFQLVAEKLAGVTDESQRLAIAQEILGKSFKGVNVDASFVKTLADGGKNSADMAASIAAAEKATQAFNKSMQQIQLVFLQVIQPILDGFVAMIDLFKDINKAIIEMSDGFITFGEIVGLVIAAIMAGTGLKLITGTIKGIGVVLKGLGLIAGGAAIGFESFDDIRKRLNGTKDAVKELNKPLIETKQFFQDVTAVSQGFGDQIAKQIRQIQAETQLIGLSEKEKDLQKAINDLKEKSFDIELKLEAMKIGASDDKIQAINEEISANQARTHSLIQDITREVKARQEAEEDFAKAYEESFKNYRDAAFNAARQARDIFQTATKGMEDAILKFVQTGKLSFKSLIQDMLNTILRSQIQQIVARIFTITGLNQAGNAIGSMLGLASGGVIPTNRPVLVGERGPEIIAGAAGRVVTPNDQLGGGSVTYNINAVDAMSFKQMVAQDPQFIYALTEQGRRSVPGTRR